MIRKFQGALWCLFLFIPISANCALQESYATSPTQVVSAFQKLPHYEAFCEDEAWGSSEPIKVGEKFKVYLSDTFYRLFLWSQCVEPEIPPHYREREFISVILWDIRFGFPFTGLLGEKSVIAENIRVQKVKLKGADKTIVKVMYDFGSLKNLVTTYILIREGGLWKIDDIAPKGDFRKDDEDYDAALEHSESIKTDMQNNYNAAEKRYLEEQAKKSLPLKQ